MSQWGNGREYTFMGRGRLYQASRVYLSHHQDFLQYYTDDAVDQPLVPYKLRAYVEVSTWIQQGRHQNYTFAELQELTAMCFHCDTWRAFPNDRNTSSQRRNTYRHVRK